MDAVARKTRRAEADGEVVWFWRPDAGVKLAKTRSAPRWRWWQQSPVARKSAKETV